MSNAMVLNEIYPASSIKIESTFGRLIVGIPLGVLATACLIWIMQSLVNSDHPLEIAEETPKIPVVVLNTPTRVTPQLDQPPVRPVEIEQPPKIALAEPVEIDPGSNPIEGAGAIRIEKPAIKSGLAISGQMIPFIKVLPEYPQAASSKGIEGYVDVMFDVTELGSTDNIRIIGFTPSSIFNRSVLKAIKNWKFKPNVVDGVPVRTPDVRDRVTFKLEQ